MNGKYATLKAFWTIVSYDSRRFSLVVTLLILIGMLEGLGLAAIMPLLSLVLGEIDPTGEDLTNAHRAIIWVFDTTGMDMTVITVLVFLVTLLLSKVIFNILVETYTAWFSSNLEAKVRNDLIDNLSQARWSFFLRHPIGSYVNAFLVEAAQLKKALMQSQRMVAYIVNIVIYLFLSILVDPIVTFGALLVGGCMFLLLSLLMKAIRKQGNISAQQSKGIGSSVTELLQGMKALKAMALEDKVRPVLVGQIDKLRHASFLQTVFKALVSQIPDGISAILMGFGLYVLLVVYKMPLEQVLMITFLFQRIIGRLTMLQNTLAGFTSIIGYLDSLWVRNDELVVAKEVPHGERPPIFNDKIEAHDVTFSYDDNQVLKGVNLVIPNKGVTVLIGPSGSGKSTFADLLLGFERASSGAITVDGVDLADCNVRNWREEIGYVPQELFLFNDTLDHNLTFGDSSLSEEKIYEALDHAGAKAIVDDLPDRLNTIVGERGGKLSGGQRQRMVMARALVRKPRLLILDEPTTALDPRTEAELCATLKSLSKEVAVFAITHQKGLLEVADHIYHIDQGVVTKEK